MTDSGAPSYGLWFLAVINVAIFVVFAFSFVKPKTARDWRSFGAFSAFIVALFAEMYGFPLTIYLLSGWLQSRYPDLDILSHNAGHLWQTLFGLQGDPHFGVLHMLSIGFIFAGFVLLSNAWRVLFSAQRSGTLASSGPYSRVRHPQYAGFIMIMFGFLLQWPTLLTLVMFPLLVFMYVRLARAEEREVQAAFGAEYQQYAARTPAFLPRLPRGTPLAPAADRLAAPAVASPGAVPLITEAADREAGGEERA